MDFFRSKINNPEIVKEKKEKLDVNFRLARPEDWESFKRLRIEAISDPDNTEASDNRIMLEQSRGQRYWEERMAYLPDDFIILATKGEHAIGMGIASRDKDDRWYIGWGYVEEAFRGKGVGKKIMANRLNEILRRGGKTVYVHVRLSNHVSLGNCRYFGFKESSQNDKEYTLRLDLSDIEVVKKIKSVLDAG